MTDSFRFWMIAMLALSLQPCAPLCPAACAQRQPRVEVAQLQEQLEAGLKARLPAEFAFIARVVDLVQQGEFSEELVKSVFTWARRKNKRVPFPYFERAMRIIAERLDVDIDGSS